MYILRTTKLCYIYFLFVFSLFFCLFVCLFVFVFFYSTSRLAEKTIEINGVTIPKGVTVQFPIYLMHYNPNFWPEPEKFDPERYSPLSSLSPCFSLHLSLPSSGSPLRRRQSGLLSATSPLAGALATALE